MGLTKHFILANTQVRRQVGSDFAAAAEHNPRVAAAAGRLPGQESGRRNRVAPHVYRQAAQQWGRLVKLIPRIETLFGKNE